MWAGLAEAMGLELQVGKISNAYNLCFYATVCHVCKRFGDGVQLKRCGGCWMISYCGKEHQKQHWKQHKPLCKAIQDALRDDISMDYRGETTEEWAGKKVAFELLVSSRLERHHLNEDEEQMFHFPRECLVCYERNIKSLESCQKCVASFCKNHVNGTEHKNFCAPLELRFRFDLLVIRAEVSPPDMRCYLRHATDKDKFLNMTDFIHAYWNIPTDSEMSRNISLVQHSLYLTRPLTVFHAMRLLNYVPKSKAIVIHVIGGFFSGEFTLMGWEVVFPRLIGTAMPVTIIIIRIRKPSELQVNINEEYRINWTSSENKNLSFYFYNMSYENYVRSKSFVKPDLVVGFDLVPIPEHKLGSSEETSVLSIKLIAKQNCPFVLTCFRLQDFRKTLDKINTILGREVCYLYSGKNPFASLCPFRTVAPEYVYYPNQYIAISRSLCN